ncbi:MAG: PTS sugar transporter subunit IIA [Lentisphaeria bacterium]|jgi:PTS system nitrogen regulatory IIA component|nr:PTS sugar transporter subunit IIA [Lentisphaeria bacterium]
MQLSVKDAARLLVVSEKTIYRWIKQEIIPAYRINEQYRFNQTELLEWATSRRIQVSPEVFAEAATSNGPLPSLSDALATGGVVYRLGGRDKPSLLRAMVDVMKLPEEVDRDFLYQVLLAREALGSTGIGDGIAVPHVRNPIVLHVNRPTVTLCFLEHPIDFGALDGKPVRVLFALVSPTVRAHLHLLSRLGFVLREPKFRSAVLGEASREDLMAALAAAERSLGMDTARSAEPAK